MGRTRWRPYAFVSLLAAAPYLATLAFDFVFDDRHLVVDNTFLRTPWSPLAAFAHHFWYGSPYGAAYYRPLVVASFALNGRLLGWGPAGFHAVNLLLHALNASLLLALARRLGCPDPAALLAAAIFAVHPVAAWPVASVVARVDLLAATFVLLAWLALVSEGSSAWLAGLCFLLGLLCKESAAAFLVVPALGLRRLRGRTAGAVAAAAILYLAARGAAGLAILPGPALIDPLINPLGVLPAGARVPAATALAGRYFLYLLVPVRFHDPVNYLGGAPLPGPPDPIVLISAAAILAAIAATLVLWLRRDSIAVPLAFAIASFLPASNLIVPIASLYAQNFLYLPLVGATLALGMALGRLSPIGLAPTPPGLVGVGILVALLGTASWMEARIWRDELSFFGTLANRFPAYAPAWSALGVALLDRGRPGEAIRPLRTALVLTDASLEAHYNLGVALLLTSSGREGREEALSHLKWVIEARPAFAPAHYQAARLLALLGRTEESESEAREAGRLEAIKKATGP